MLAKMWSRRAFFGLSRTRVGIFVAMTVAAGFFEGFGMAMFLPVLEYVEKGRDLAVLTSGSGMWRRLVQVFDALGLEISLLSLLAAAVGMMILRVVFIYARQVYTAWLSQEILHVTRAGLFEGYLHLDMETFSSHSSGGIINVLTTEAQRVGGGFGGLLSLISNAVVVAGFLGVLIWLSAPMTGLAMVFIALSGVVVAHYVRHTTRCSHAVHKANDAFSRTALERLGAFRLIKLTATAGRESAALGRASEGVRDTNYWMSKLIARIDLIMEPLVLLAGGAILYLAVTAFGMNLAQVGLFMLILIRLLPLCKELLRSKQTWNSCTGSLLAVLKDMDDTAARRETEGGERPFTGLEQGIRLENVDFRYAGADDAALMDVTLDIPAGKVTALVGPSGAGKTTLADLLPRLRVPQSGRVLYDGVDGAEFNLPSLRLGMAFVSQDAAILDDTVAANLRFSRPDADEAAIWNALERARAKEFVQSLPDGLQTRLGERGTRLSGGQKQRLSLARALLQGTGVLILDEPTSALDSETERDIQRAIDELRATGRATIVIIAHRLSTIRGADQIVVLEGGRVTEHGSHADLMVSEDWYSRVSGMQSAAGQGE